MIDTSQDDLFQYAERLQQNHPDTLVQIVKSTDSTQNRWRLILF